MVEYLNLILNTVTMFYDRVYVPLDLFFEFSKVLLLLFGVYLAVRFVIYPIIRGRAISAGSDTVKKDTDRGKRHG